MNPSRIIFVNRFFHPDQSATSRLLSDLAFHLAREGRAVTVIAGRGLYDDASAALPAYERCADVDIHRVYLPRYARKNLAGRVVDSLMMYVSFARAVMSLARPGDRLIVKTDPPLLGVALAPIARLKRLRLIHWLQDLYPEVALALGVRALAPIAPLLLHLRDRSLRAAAKTVVISERMRRRIAACGVPADRIEVIYNWCDDKAIRPLAVSDNAFRVAHRLQDRFVVGYSGNLGRAHEYQTLLGAAYLLRHDTDIAFLFIGGGHHTEELKREVSLLGMERSFCFLPYQPESELAQSLSAPDIHWLSQPPAMEGLILPSKFYGVAAAGRPIAIVGATDGELAELVARHACGAAIAVGDSESLAAFITSLKNNPQAAQEMGANARAMLDAGLRREDSFARWTEMLDSL